MTNHPSTMNQHFNTEPLAQGVYACIHQPGGGAYANAGIIDLGDQTLVVDAFQTLAAGRALRQAAETLCGRPVETIVLTHAHPDHWAGLSAFEAVTTVLASQATRQDCLEWGPEMLEDFQNPDEWQAWREQIQQQLAVETDENVRLGLENNLTFIGYVLAEMAEFSLRYPDLTFESTLTMQGSQRLVEVRSLGRGHSQDDTVILLPTDGIAFIGDIGFFDSQPFLGFCDFERYRAQLHFFQEADFRVLVPGHGPVGGKDDIDLQLRYFDVMEERVGEVVQRGGALAEALAIALPEPFSRWLAGGRERFEVNVRFTFKMLGGEVGEEKE